MPAHTVIVEAALGLLAASSYAGGLGVVRLLLALLVVGSHVGGLGSTNAGGVGIAGFFAISGFLMAQTILNNYRGAGIVRFYFNRFIRLAPPLAALLALTASIVWMRDSEGFQITLDATTRFMPVELPPSPIHWFNWGRRGYPTFLEPSFYTLPQA